MKRLFLILSVVTGLGCACAFAQGGTETITTTTNFVFPPVGLASGYTAAVNLVNIAPASTAANATTPSCTGTVTFTNANGTVLGTAATFTAKGSQIATETVTAATVGVTATTPRAEVVASVQQTTTRPATAPCALVFSLEVYDSTGATHVFLGNASAATAPAPVTTAMR